MRKRIRKDWEAYELINVDEHTGLSMLGRQIITVDGYSPALVPRQIYIAVQAPGYGGELGTKQKDVDATIGRGLVQEVCHRLLQDAFREIGNKVAVDDNCCAALLSGNMVLANK